MDLQLAKKQCNLTDIEVNRLRQRIENPDRYSSSMTIKELNVSYKKIDALLENGFVKKVGVGYYDGSSVGQTLFSIA